MTRRGWPRNDDGSGAAFIEHAMSFQPGVHVCNYVDKPDFSMNELVASVRSQLGKAGGMRLRVKKFCANSVF